MSPACGCALEASGFHMTLMLNIGPGLASKLFVMSGIMLVGTLKLDFQWVEMCASKLCTVKFKHSTEGTGRKTHFWLEGTCPNYTKTHFIAFFKWFVPADSFRPASDISASSLIQGRYNRYLKYQNNRPDTPKNTVGLFPIKTARKKKK